HYYFYILSLHDALPICVFLLVWVCRIPVLAATFTAGIMFNAQLEPLANCKGVWLANGIYLPFCFTLINILPCSRLSLALLYKSCKVAKLFSTSPFNVFKLVLKVPILGSNIISPISLRSMGCLIGEGHPPPPPGKPPGNLSPGIPIEPPPPLPGVVRSHSVKSQIILGGCACVCLSLFLQPSSP